MSSFSGAAHSKTGRWQAGKGCPQKFSHLCNYTVVFSSDRSQSGFSHPVAAGQRSVITDVSFRLSNGAGCDQIGITRIYPQTRRVDHRLITRIRTAEFCHLPRGFAAIHRIHSSYYYCYLFKSRSLGEMGMCVIRAARAASDKTPRPTAGGVTVGGMR